MSTAPLDGNAAAGDLADVFAFDVTTAMVTCAVCRHTQAVATLRTYLRVPGMVLRCASCDAVASPLRARAPTGVARLAWHRDARNPAADRNLTDRPSRRMRQTPPMPSPISLAPMMRRIAAMMPALLWIIQPLSRSSVAGALSPIA